MNNKIKQYLLFIALVIWGVVSVVALAEMYKLWWNRERIQYLNKTAEEQRVVIWKSSGLPINLLNVYKEIEKSWPKDISYSTSGDFNQLSYLKYLLIPKNPKGSDTYKVSSDGRFSPKAEVFLNDHQIKRGFPIFSILGSLFVFLGISVSLRFLYCRYSFSFPEIFGCSLFLCMACTVLSRVFLATSIPAFYLLTFLGMLSWLWVAVQKIFYKKAFEITSLTYDQSRSNPPLRIWQRVGALFLGCIITLSIFWAFLMSVIVVPDDWDAWAIWAAKAKVLALGHGPLLDVSYFGHANYPLLWPSVWAYSGWLGGGWEEMWTRGWGSVFLLLCIWELMVIGIRITGRRDLGLLCGALFASVPMVPLIASWSYSDIPLCFFITASFGCLIIQRPERTRVSIGMAALLAAAAAYTKNEGVMFALLISFSILFFPGRRQLRDVLLFLGIFVMLYTPWIIWAKVVHHFSSSATEGLYFDLGNIQRAWQRFPKAIEAIGKMWIDMKQWNIVLWVSLLFLFIGLGKKQVRSWLIVPTGMLLVYFVIIVFHEAQIYWQVGTSWNRLTVHVLPFLLIGLVYQIWTLLELEKKPE
jgi:hypothetical protein